MRHSSTPPHILPDLLAPGLRVVFCGTAAGTQSAARRAYYAGPGNKFWPTLHSVGLTERLFAPEQYPLLLERGIGLTDLCKHVSGADSTLRAQHFDRERLRAVIAQYQPRVLAFTSKKAGETFFGEKRGYGRQRDKIGVTEIHILPSPSGLASGAWSAATWKRLAKAI